MTGFFMIELYGIANKKAGFRTKPALEKKEGKRRITSQQVSL